MHQALEEETSRKVALLAEKQASRRALSAANAEFRKEVRMEQRLVKKASKYSVEVFAKIMAKKEDLPFIVCRRCACVIDSRRAIRRAVAEVAAGRAVNVQSAGLPLLGDAAAAEAAQTTLRPEAPNEEDLALGHDAATAT